MPSDPMNFDPDWSRPEETVEVDLFCLASVLLVVIGILQFLEGIYQAISVFPEPFSIFNRFLSELGRDSNATVDSRRLFERSTVLLGLSMLPFFYGIARAHAEELPGQTTAFCACGIVSAVGLMGIGVTPYNQYLTFHIFAILLWLVPMLFMVLRPLPGMQQHTSAEVTVRRFAVWGAGVYLPGMLLVPILRHAAGLHFVWIVMLAQKALVLAAILWLATLLRFIVSVGLQQLRRL